MQTIHSSIISFFITSLLIANGYSQDLSDEHLNSSGSLDNNNDFNQQLGSSGELEPYTDSLATSSSINPQYLSPEIIPTSPSSTFIVTATRVDTPQYVYPEEPPKELFVTTGTPTIDEEDSQIAQPDFSPEQIDREEIEVPTEQQTEQQEEQQAEQQQNNEDEFQTTQIPMEETTLQDIEDEVATNYDNLGEVSNDLNVDLEGENDDNNETDTENETQLPEPLPTPIALISSNGEGSNPPLEEEFAEAFKRVGPNGRRVRPGGRRRVRMRVRKMKKDNSTQNSMENQTLYPMQDKIDDDELHNNYVFETTTVRPRRYRSTTQAPELNFPIIPSSPLVVKNGPKPMIITDIHSGSTGLNPITSEPQLEKPILGGYTEKISTYFVSPPARISTTEAPKLPSNLSSDDPGLNSLGDSKALGSNPFENQRESWEKNLMNLQPNSFFSTSTESTDRSSSFATPPKANVETNLHNENTENSLQQPPMQDRTYTVNENGNHNDPHGFETGNSFDTTPASLGTGPSNNGFVNPYSFNGGETTEGQPGSNEPHQESFSRMPFNRFETNVPFVTNSNQNLPTSGSHYDRTKDQFLNGNQNQQQFLKDSTNFQSNDQDKSLKSQIEYAHAELQNQQGNELQEPQIEHSQFSSTSSPNLEEYFNNQNSNHPSIEHQYGNYQSQAENEAHIEHGKEYDSKNTQFNEGFKSSPADPMLNGGLRKQKPYPPPFRKVPSFNDNSGFGYNGPIDSPPISNGYEYNSPVNGPSVSNGFSHQNPNPSGPSPDEFIMHNYPPSREGFPDTNPNSFNTASGFSHFSGGPSDQSVYPQGTQNSIPSNSIPGYNQGNQDIITTGADPSVFSQSSDPLPLPPLSLPNTGPVFGTVENVPIYENNNGDNNHLQQQQHQNNINSPNYPVFVANSPGEQTRPPKFMPPRPHQSPPSAYHRGLNFFRNSFRSQGPPMHHPPRFFQNRPNGQDYRGDSSSYPSNYRGGQNPHGLHGRPPPDFQNSLPHMSEQQGRPPPDFQNSSPHVQLHMPGLQGIPHPPSEQQALSEVSPIHHFPPHTHSMSSKPDYEPANPPLPHGHPLENHFDIFPENNNGGDNNNNNHHHHHEENHQEVNHLNNFQNSNNGGQLGSSTGDTQLTAPSLTTNEDHTPSSNGGPDFDIISAYYDKPPPTVGYDYNNQYRMKETPVQEVKDNDLLNVPYQYSNTDGGGLDGGPYFHNYESNKPTKVNSPENNKPEEHETEPQPHHSEEKNKTSVYSDTPYVLMFPQLVPQEAMVPPPPKMLTKEIPVVSASSMSSMRFTPEGKPVLGPGLKAVPVHPRHQMYQVLAKAHYDKTMQKYMESKKKPPSAIYTPYGVLVPMGPSGSAASTNHETYTAMQSKLHPHRKEPRDKQLLNLLLGKQSSLLGKFNLQKGTSIKNGRLKKHFDFKANVDPALDLLAEKLAIKLGAVKYVLTAPAKLGIHAFSKHSTSYSELKPVTVNPSSSKEKGETGLFISSKGFLGLGNKGKENSKSESSTSEGKSLQETNPELKEHLKALLKERLREVLDEVETESREIQSPRSGQQNNFNMMMPMQSTVVETKVAPPMNSNIFANYFNQNTNHGSVGLMQTIKRLFSFGGSSDNSRSDGNNGRSEGSGFPSFSSFSAKNSSSHPFSWYGFNALNSIGRMGSSIMHPGPSQDEYLKTTHKFKSEKKATKQLEKWLDIVLKSSETSSNHKPIELKTKPSTLSESTSKLKQIYYGNPLTSAKLPSSSVRILPPTKLSQVSNPKRPSAAAENLLKKLGQPTVSTTVMANTPWTPVVSAFKTVFNYAPGKNPTVLKQKTL